MNKMANKKIQNSNYSCDDNVTNFVKFMKKDIQDIFSVIRSLYNIVTENIKINKLVFLISYFFYFPKFRKDRNLSVATDKQPGVAKFFAR